MRKMKAMIALLAILAFALIVLAVFYDGLIPGRRQGKLAQNAPQGVDPMARIEKGISQRERMRPLVVAKTVAEKIMNDHLTAIGTGRAQSTVDLTPWSSGVIVSFYVKAGDHVAKGDPVAKLDSDNEEIALERARVEFEDAQAAHMRIVHLRDSNTASRVQVSDAELALARSKLALRDAELALERRTIRSPQSGIVGILPVDVGNYVTASTPIARIGDYDKILVDIWVPERFAPLMQIGQAVVAEAVAISGVRFSGYVSAIDNAIDETSRTLRVRCEIANRDDSLRAGMSFKVTLLFSGEAFTSVDPLALQWNAQGSYVWRLHDHKVMSVPVVIVQRNVDSVLVRGDLKEGDMIVTQGVQNLREGGEVTLREAGKDNKNGERNIPPSLQRGTPARVSTHLR